LNYNGSKFIEELFDSLSKQTFKDFEVVFVDNASTDHSLQLLDGILARGSLEKLHVEIIKNSVNLGYCKGNNIGFKHTNGNYVVFLNNDTYVSTDWLQGLVKDLDSHPHIGACQSRIMFAGTNRVQTVGNLLDRFLSSGIDFDVYNQVKHMEKGMLVNRFFYPSGASTAYRRTLLEKIEAFDEKLFYGDYDLGWRTRLLGYKIATCLSSICYHYGGQATKELFRKGNAFQDYKERIYVMAKNYFLSTFLKRIPASLVLWFLESFYSSLKFGEYYVAMLVKAIFWNITNLRSLIIERRKIQQIRVISDKEIEEHMLSYPIFIYGLREKIRSVLTRW
jgi:GT2 family glycosyltransferase